jgi:hypothetical protein
MRKFLGFGAVVLVAAAFAGAAPAAIAGPSAAAAVIRTGSCSGPSTWKLTLKHDAGRIESDLEVQTPTAGQTWHYVMKDNGVRFAAGNKTTMADGSFSVTRFAANQAGTDHILAKASNLTTGEVCRATAAI